MQAPNPLIAAGVVASTALTDAVYVLFNSAVTARLGSPLQAGAAFGTCSPPLR